MLPYIEPQDRLHFCNLVLETVHKRVVLVCSRSHCKASLGCEPKPCPATSKSRQRRFPELLLHCIQAPKGLVNRLLDCWRGLPTRSCRGHVLPES